MSITNPDLQTKNDDTNYESYLSNQLDYIFNQIEPHTMVQLHDTIMNSTDEQLLTSIKEVIIGQKVEIDLLGN